jgi:hypothetical protein
MLLEKSIEQVASHKRSPSKVKKVMMEQEAAEEGEETWSGSEEGREEGEIDPGIMVNKETKEPGEVQPR